MKGYLYILSHGSMKYIGPAYFEKKTYTLFSDANPDGAPFEDFGEAAFLNKKVSEEKAYLLYLNSTGLRHNPGGLSLSQAQALRSGDYIHSLTKKNADGTPMRARVTLVKTWKRDPSRVEIHYKRGMYEYGTISERDLDGFATGYGS